MFLSIWLYSGIPNSVRLFSNKLQCMILFTLLAIINVIKSDTVQNVFKIKTGLVGTCEAEKSKTMYTMALGSRLTQQVYGAQNPMFLKNLKRISDLTLTEGKSMANYRNRELWCNLELGAGACNGGHGLSDIEIAWWWWQGCC